MRATLVSGVAFYNPGIFILAHMRSFIIGWYSSRRLSVLPHFHISSSLKPVSQSKLNFI